MARGDTLLWTLTAGHLITHWYEGVFYLLLVYIARDLGFSMAQVGLLIGLKFWTTALINMPLGFAVDLIGRRHLIMVSALAWLGIPYLLAGFSHSFPTLGLCVMMMSLGGQVWHPAALPTISEAYPQRRGYALAIHSLGANAGDALAPLAVGLLLAVFSWRTVAFLQLLPGLVAAPLLWYFLNRRIPPPPPAHPEEPTKDNPPRPWRHYVRDLGQRLQDGPVLRVLLLVGFRGLVQNGLLAFTPFFLVQNLGLPAPLAGAYLSGFQTGGALGAPLSGWLSDRIGRQPVARAGLLLCGLLVLAVATLPLGRWVILPLVGLGAFLYAARPVLQAWTLDSLPSDMGGAAVGLTFGTQALFSSLAPVLGGMLADRYGLTTALYFLAATALLASFLCSGIPEGAQPKGLQRQPVALP